MAECELLRNKDIPKLCDDQHGRCTLPLLMLLIDFFLKKFDFKRVTFIAPDGRQTHSPSQEFPDIVKILETCRKAIWYYGSQPHHWYYYLSERVYERTCTVLRKVARCGRCKHYGLSRKWCMEYDREVDAWDTPCEDKFDTIEFGTTKVPIAGTLSNDMNKVYARILYLFIERAKKYPGQEKYKRLTIVAQEILFGTFHRGELAQAFGVSSKTVDRLREEVMELICSWSKKDIELMRLIEVLSQPETGVSEYHDISLQDCLDEEGR